MHPIGTRRRDTTDVPQGSGAAFGRDSPKTLVSREVDLINPPPLTERQKAKLEALAAMPDKAIDYSDIPPLPDSFFANVVRGMFKQRREDSTRSASSPRRSAPVTLMRAEANDGSARLIRSVQDRAVGRNAR